MAYTTKADVKTYLGITGSGDDTLIDALIVSAQQAINTHCKRTFEASEDSARYPIVGVDTEGPWLYLKEDLCSITSVYTNHDLDGTGVEVLITQYMTTPRKNEGGPYHALKILASSGKVWEYTNDPEKGIKINGKWAYSETAPADIVHACKRLVGYYYRQKDAQVFDVTAIPDAGVITVPQGIPADVAILLDEYVRRSAYGN